MTGVNRRRFIAGLCCALAHPAGLWTRPGYAQGRILPSALTITSVSWIDSEGLPELTYPHGVRSLLSGYWPFRVMVGLVATSKPRPADPLPDDFQAGKQFRAMIQYRIEQDGTVSGTMLDLGYTPPVDSAKLPLGIGLGVPDDPKFYEGESSALSQIVPGGLHPASSLRVPDGYTVLAGALIKFRAGEHTNALCIKEALSSYRVPWVWCEHAIVAQGNRLTLLANGSRFPSHAWYVDGKLLGALIQAPLTMSDKEAAVSTGPSAKTTLGKANDDRVTGVIDTHPYTVARRQQTQISLYVSL